MNNKKGFTLTEIIVVLVILAVLAAFTIPTMLGFVSHSQESLCDTQRKDIVRLFETQSRMTSSLGINSFIKDNYGDSQHLCPAGGNYYAYSYFEDEDSAVAVVYCSEHTTTADGKLYVLSRQVMDQFNELTEVGQRQAFLDISNQNFSNDNFRKKIFKENGNTWNPLGEEIKNKLANPSQHTNDYIQPYITLDKQVVLYANGKNEAQGNWMTSLIFNHEEGVWYEKIDKTSFGMHTMGPQQTNLITWEALKTQFADEQIWRAIR
ncbi:MAG: prepilin-type N-terminal cleavage/methylation domain-containing protein [Acetobacterium sp.]|nr:prepilin-type N-terminal cleavage/methylation domain-containing protein [Acetobacterium sp.]